MASCDAVLFDFDGVLMDSEPVHFDCWREVLAPFGVGLDWETYISHCVGVADLEMLDYLRLRSGTQATLEEIWKEYPRKKALFVERIRHAPPIPDAIKKLLTALNGYKLAVVSSSAREEVEPLLTAAGIRPFFLAVVCGEDVENLKPAPDPYLRAAALLGARSPVVVEDSDVGLRSGRAAGFEVIQVREPGETPRLVMEKLGLNF